MHNRELDEIGRRLIGKSSLSEAETDRIADSPRLFDAVRARIAQEPTAETVRPSFRWLAAASGFGLVLFVAIFASFYFSGRETETATQENPAAKPDFARSEITPQVISDLGITPDRAIPERTIQRIPSKSAVRKPKPQPIPEVEFYPVTFAGDTLDAARGGRVIRVDMPRSSLFAMGLNVPLENETGSIKADLLVGPDGVTRGIRLVE